MSLTEATAVCWGAGWDSTAMLIEMEKRGERPEMITFADTGGEKPGTYAFIPVFRQWLRDHDFPDPIVCEYKPKDLTEVRYRSAVRAVAARLKITLDDVRQLLQFQDGELDPCGEVQSLIEARLRDLEARLEQLRTVRGVLRTSLEACHQRAASGRCEVLESLAKGRSVVRRRASRRRGKASTT